MATTTPNFGWAVPTSTDLVKDGAVAIETLGDAIDASLVDLKGGTTGQVLSKTSNTDMDFTWVAQDDSNAIQNAIVDAKGDIIAATANDTPARLAVGTNGQVLTADSTAATGLKWATAASGSTFAGVSVHNDYYSIAFTAYTDQFLDFASADQWDTNAYHDTATNNTRLTIPTGAGGKYLLTCFFSGGSSTQKLFTLKVNGATPASLPVGISGSMAAIRTAGDPLCFSIVLNLAAADYVQMAVQANATGTETGCYNTLQLSYLGA